MLPEVVMFDLDDTLFDHRRAVELGLSVHRLTLGGEIAGADDATEQARWYALEESIYHRYLTGELDFLGQRRARVRAFVEPYGVDLTLNSDTDDWFDGYLREYERSWALHEDALACLDELDATGVRIGIITNGDISFQTAKLQALALVPRLEHVIASGEFGIAKPDARIFEHACATFGVPASDAAYVGDRLRTDAIGAARAGLTGVWLRRGGATLPGEEADAAASGVLMISSLDELVAALER